MEPKFLFFNENPLKWVICSITLYGKTLLAVNSQMSCIPSILLHFLSTEVEFLLRKCFRNRNSCLGGYRRTQLWICSAVMPVFKRSITASRITKNYQFRLITFGATAKSVKHIFNKQKLTWTCFSTETPCTFAERNTQFLGDKFGKILFTLLDLAPKVINRNW